MQMIELKCKNVSEIKQVGQKNSHFRNKKKQVINSSYVVNGT